jgi:ribosomal protein L37AE/L43A
LEIGIVQFASGIKMCQDKGHPTFVRLSSMLQICFKCELLTAGAMMPAANLSQAVKTSWQSFNTKRHYSGINTVFE